MIGLCSGGGAGGRPIPAALCFAFQEQVENILYKLRGGGGGGGGKGNV